MTFLNACRNGQKGIVQIFLKKGGIDLNRKVLSEMAINAPEAFAELVKSVTK